MKVKSSVLEAALADYDVPEKTYATLVTDMGTGTQMSVTCDARADIVAGSMARYAFYCTFGQGTSGILTQTVLVGDPELRVAV